MKKPNSELIERCHKCLIKVKRKDLKHIQVGFGVVWRCKDAEKCEKRKKKL